MSTDDKVDRALAELDRGPVSASWRGPDELRSIARRRTRSRRASVAAAAAIVTAGVVVAIVPRNDAAVRTPVRLANGLRVGDRSGDAVQLVADVSPAGPSASSESAVSHAEQAFTVALLKQANSLGGSGNVVLSPSSLAIALAMLQTGAGGSTRDEIAKVLQTSALTSAQQDAGWSALVADLAGPGSGATVESANSLWLQQDLPMQQAFMAALARYFKTGVWQVDFAHHLSAAADAINAWVSEHTNAKITKLFNKGDIDPSTALVIANAVYFDATWKDQFDPAETADAPFHPAGGNTANVPFMALDAELSTAITPDYEAVQLPYVGGRFAAVLVMPLGQTLGQLVDGLSSESLSQLTSSLAPRGVDLRMPKVTATSYTKLNGTLAAMGMPTAFTPAANFSAMSPTELMVQTVAQRDYLRMDEKGTEAAAVTGISMVPTSASVGIPITLDHPFLCLVRDTKTGAILFASQIRNPAA